jgi:hypothetical protein
MAAETCILCGRKPRFVGIFTPHQHARGRLKPMTYLLCGRCRRRPDSQRRVEAMATRADDPQRN